MAKTESINIKPILKRFLENKKIDLKNETGVFYGVSAVLMRYLEGNNEFLVDFQSYCKKKRVKDLVKIPEAEKIIEQDNGELLSLLTSGVVTKK